MSPVIGSSASVYRQRSPRRLWAADALTIALVSSVAGAVALFLRDGGAAGFGTLTKALTARGVIAGLAAMDLVLVMFLLSARAPVIDRTIGQDKALLRPHSPFIGTPETRSYRTPRRCASRRTSSFCRRAP
jgi:hypothetical protein